MTYSIVIPTDYGQMIVNRHDINQTRALIQTSAAYDVEEVKFAADYVGLLAEGSTVLDIGANLGVYTLAMARVLASRKGVVHAFEAQRILAYMLCGSVVLNSLENALVHHKAVGAGSQAIDIPAFDYHIQTNFGSIEFGPEQRETLSQSRQAAREKVEQVRLDDLDLHHVKFMKIDVEGMEWEVLQGARQLVERDRPLVLIEWLKSDRNVLANFFVQQNYDVFVWGMNFLCIPQENPYTINHNFAPWRSSQ